MAVCFRHHSLGLLLLSSTIISLCCFHLILTVRSEHRFDDRHQEFTLRTSPEKYLRPRPGEPFKIALFADLHFGEDAWTDWGPRQDANSIRVMSNVLGKEAPDFVVYLGDVITANNIPVANASLYWDQAVSPTRSRGIPWASIFGNHDDAPFVWPLEWFSSPGIPQFHCPATNSSISVLHAIDFRGGRMQLQGDSTLTANEE